MGLNAIKDEIEIQTLRAEVDRLLGERDAVKARKEEVCRVLVASSVRNKAANVRIEKLYDMLRAVIVALGGVAEQGVSDELLSMVPEEAAAMKARAEAAEAEVIRLRGELAAAKTVISECNYALVNAKHHFASHAGEEMNVAICESALRFIARLDA